MTTLKFPNYIYAVGGAGKEIIFHMLKKEWILKEILKPGSNPNFCKVIVIDTALDEENSDKESIKEIQKKKDKIRSEYIHRLEDEKITDVSIGDIEIDYELITKSMKLTTPADLVGNDIKNKILSSTDASCYWLSDDKISPDWHLKIMTRENLQNLNFAKGVYRKRAIGKAIYYKALAERAFMVDNHPQSKIAIVCGFGGGTGSGIALDLAKEIKVNQQASDITLFGVLSTLNESEDEKANCCGMLSELEYIKISDNSLNRSNNGSNVTDDFSIQEKNIFENIILLPIEATRYGGEQSADPVTKEFLLQFDDAFPYSMIAYYNMAVQLFFEDIPSFAPFTIAIPQLVRFNIDQIRKMEERIYKKKSCKETSLESEDRIYGMLDDYINKHFTKKNNELTDEDKLILYNNRFYKYKTILGSKYFSALNYSSILKLKESLDIVTKDLEEELENKNLYQQVEQLIQTLIYEIIGDGINIAQSPGQTDLDSSLFKLLIDDTKMMMKQIETLRSVNSIEDLYTVNILKSIIRLEEEGLGHILNKINSKVKNLVNLKNDKENSKSQIKTSMENFNIEIESLIETENKNIKNKYREKFSELNNLEDNLNNLRDKFTTLNQELKIFVSELNKSRKSQVDSISLESINGSIQAIESIIAKNNLKLSFNGQEITSGANRFKSLRKAIIDSNKNISFFDRLKPGQTKSERIRNEGIDNRKMLISFYENTKLKVNINNNEIEINYKFNIDDEIDELKNELINNVLSDTKEKFENAELFLYDDLKKNLADPAKRRTLTLEPIIKSNAGYDDKLSEFENKLNQSDKIIANFNEKIINYTDLKTLVQNIAPYYKKHSGSLENYHSFMLGNELQEIMDISRKDDNAKYVYEMQPRDMFQVLALKQDIRKIVENHFDRADLVKNIKNSLDKTISANYNLLISNAIGNTLRQWNYSKLAFCLISKVNRREINQAVFDHVYSLKANFGISDQANLNRWYLENEDDWSVGMATFISSVPLDNIRNFVLPNGFFSSYQIRKCSSDRMSFFHCAYMLQSGKLIYRKKIHDIKNEDKDLFLIPAESEKELKDIIDKNIEREDLSEYAKNIS